MSTSTSLLARNIFGASAAASAAATQPIARADYVYMCSRGGCALTSTAFPSYICTDPELYAYDIDTMTKHVPWIQIRRSGSSSFGIGLNIVIGASSYRLGRPRREGAHAVHARAHYI